MKLEIDMPEHHYNSIIAFDSVSLGRVPYKGIIMYAINAIKHGRTLEQEPIKPMVEIDLYSVIKQKYIEREVLDKLRAEIEKTKTTMNMFNREDTKQYAIAMEDVLKIIDKYKTESEG